MSAQASTPKPAFLISSLRLLQPENLGPFRQAAAPVTMMCAPVAASCGVTELGDIHGPTVHQALTLLNPRDPTPDPSTASKHRRSNRKAWKVSVYCQGKRIVAAPILG